MEKRYCVAGLRIVYWRVIKTVIDLCISCILTTFNKDDYDEDDDGIGNHNHVLQVRCHTYCTTMPQQLQTFITSCFSWPTPYLPIQPHNTQLLFHHFNSQNESLESLLQLDNFINWMMMFP